MIAIDKAVKMGISECVSILGKEFVTKNKDNACYWHDTAGVNLNVGVGVSDGIPPEKRFRLTEKPLKYRANVTVNRRNGQIVKGECIIP